MKKLEERTITVDRLKHLFEYRDGKVYRRVDVQGARYPAGSRAGCEVSAKSVKMRTIRIDGVACLEHRVVYALVHGSWPEQFIDHENGDTLDNRIENLRDVSNRENTLNRKLHKSNTSGTSGVNWNNTVNKWAASIKVNYKNIHLGVFTYIEDAIAARKDAEIKHGFHVNHGKPLVNGSRDY